MYNYTELDVDMHARTTLWLKRIFGFISDKLYVLAMFQKV